MRVIGWTAVSTKEQAGEDKVSLQTQEAKIREVCQQHQWNLVKILEVPGESRSITFLHEAMARIPQMNELVQMAADGQLDCLVTYSYDRLSRTMALLAQLKDYLTSCGVQIYSISQPVEPAAQTVTNSAVTDAVMLMSGFGAQLEVANFVDRSRRGKRGASLKGRYVAPARPFGYRRTGRSTLEQNPVEAEWLRYMYRRYMEGVGLRTIASELNRAGVKGPRGGDFHPISVGERLWSPLYYGKVTWGKTRRATIVDPVTGKRIVRQRPTASEPIVADGQHAPIFTENEYRAIMAEKHRRSRGGRRLQSQRYVYPLTGILMCGYCGSPMHIHGTSGPDRGSYLCAGASCRGCCGEGAR